MIPKPTNREQARSNAILAAEEAHRHMKPTSQRSLGQGWTAMAQAWAAIAETFPREETVVGDPVFDTDGAKRPMWVTDEERETLEALRSGQATVHLAHTPGPALPEFRPGGRFKTISRPGQEFVWRANEYGGIGLEDSLTEGSDPLWVSADNERVIHGLIAGRLSWSDSGKMVMLDVDLERYAAMPLTFSKIGNRWEVRLADKDSPGDGAGPTKKPLGGTVDR